MTRAKAQDWLERLSGENWGPLSGELILVNMYLCLKINLVKAETVRRFLTDCINAPGPAALQQFSEICQPPGSGRPTYFALKQVKTRYIDLTEDLVNIIDTGNFGTYILHPSHVHALNRALPLGIRCQADEERYDEYLNSVAGTDWAIPGSRLGKPAPGQKNCWFTIWNEMRPLIDGPTPYSQKANAARDALGLIQHREGAALIAIVFPGTAVANQPAIEIGQPTFADGINRRYAASQPGSMCKSNRTKRWGTTANLEKIASSAPETCGLPERICSPVPIEPKRFTPRYLGKVSKNRGDSPHESDAAFVGRLRGPADKSAMIKFILLKVYP